MPHSFEFVWILSHGISWLDWSFVPRKSPCWRHGRRGEARVAHALPWNTFFWKKATIIARATGKSSVSETTFHWRWQTMCWPSWKTSPRSEEVVVIGRHQVVKLLGTVGTNLAGGLAIEPTWKGQRRCQPSFLAQSLKWLLQQPLQWHPLLIH